MNTLEEYRQRFAETVSGEKHLHETVQVEVKPLTVKQAIGKPKREDFPLQKGKERILEASFKGSRGQAFTDSFSDYRGTMADLLELNLNDRFQASLFCAAANATLRHLGLVSGTIHCRDQEPSLCAPKLIEYLAERHPTSRRVALVGLQPALAVALAQHYDLNILDLDPDNIGRRVGSARIRDGHTELAEAIAQSDLVLATGSTLCNNTIDKVLAAANGLPVVFFGITIAGTAALLNLERFCPLGH